MEIVTKADGLYFNWLCDSVSKNGTDGLVSNYIFLMETLHRKDFYWTVAMDKNRAEDGQYLRKRFMEHTGVLFDDQTLYSPCSVLEMMVALACRMDDDILYNFEKGTRANEWFYKMIEGMGLESCTDEKWDDLCLDIVNHAVNVMLDRDYSKNGSGGGMFPTKTTKINQKKSEIWMQMINYIRQNRIK